MTSNATPHASRRDDFDAAPSGADPTHPGHPGSTLLVAGLTDHLPSAERHAAWLRDPSASLDCGFLTRLDLAAETEGAYEH